MRPDLGKKPSRQIPHQANKVLCPVPVFYRSDIFPRARLQDFRLGAVGDMLGQMADRLDLEFQDIPFLSSICYLEDVFRAFFIGDVKILVPLAGKFPGRAS